MSLGTQKKKTGPDDLGTAENDFRSAKKENETRRPRYRRKRVRAHKTLKRDSTPSVPPKTRPDAQNMKTGPEALCTAENVFGSKNLKTEPDAVGTAENEFGRAKHENGSRRSRFRRK
jgi:hypothetical protein